MHGISINFTVCPLIDFSKMPIQDDGHVQMRGVCNQVAYVVFHHHCGQRPGVHVAGVEVASDGQAVFGGDDVVHSIGLHDPAYTEVVNIRVLKEFKPHSQDIARVQNYPCPLKCLDINVGGFVERERGG